MRLFKPLLAVFFLAIAEPAMAQQVCAQLQNQLAQTGAGGNAAYQQARAAYDNAYRQAQQMGCITLFRIFAPPQCRAVTQNLDQLRASVDAFERGGQNQPGASRAAIIAALQANGCTLGGAVNRPRSDTFRTVCVRPADGYFFPISFATTDDHFPTDQALCERQCVGASLFVYRNPGGTMGDAVDLTGQRYVDMPFAYRYQTAFDPSIRCSADATFVAANTPAPAPPPAAEPEFTVPVPLPRPVRSEDPETRANRAGGFFPGSPSGAEPILTANGIRLIGPAFYYAQ